MKFAVKNLIITGAVVSATLLSLGTANTKPVTAQSLDAVNNSPINTEYNSNCHGQDSGGHEGHQSSPSTPKK